MPTIILSDTILNEHSKQRSKLITDTCFDVCSMNINGWDAMIAIGFNAAIRWGFSLNHVGTL